MQALYSEIKDKIVNIIGLIHENDDFEVASDILRKNNVTFTNIISNKDFKELMSEVRVLPTSIFVNSKGEIVGEIVLGARDKREYKNLIKKILKEIQ